MRVPPYLTSSHQLVSLILTISHWLTTAVLVHAQDPPAPYLATPTSRQLAWHTQEYYAFVHFGPNTFTDEEWGESQQPPDVFAPSALDTDQWAAAFADAGMAGFILTAKHHDGMALWRTNTTTYQVGNGAWGRNQSVETRDVVRMAAASAKKYGLRFGVYLSPWDIHRDAAMPKPDLAGTVYDEPQIFGDDNAAGGDYNTFYAAQLTELVTMTLPSDNDNSTTQVPVELSEIWLDGASGSDTIQTFNWTLFRDIIRAAQPTAIMWGHQGVDARWVGNEDGVTVPTNWHTIDRTQDDARYDEASLQTGVRGASYWTPAEADARLRTGWFWHAGEAAKTSGELWEMYLSSVGRSVNLLLDVPPDTTGRIPLGDVDVLVDFRAVREAFLNRTVLVPGLVVNASSVREGETRFGPANVLDGRSDTYWALEDAETTGWLEVELGATYAIDAFVTQEHIALGQRVGGYAVDAWVEGAFETLVNGTSLGYKRIDRLESAVETGKIRLRVTQADATPVIQSFQALGVLTNSG